MPLFYLNLVGDEVITDAEGVDLPNLAAAIDYAILGGRQIVADTIVSGKTARLDHYIEVTDADAVVLHVVVFADIIRFVG